MARCMVTGGAGFIGSNLIDELIKQGDEVVIIDDLSTGYERNIHPEAEFHKVDIRDIEAIKPLFKDINYVYHLAAFTRVQPSIDDPYPVHDINMNGTFNVLLAAKEAGVKKLVYSASCAAYGDNEDMPLKETAPVKPMSPYALQKYTGELYCSVFSRVYGLPTVALRYFNVYGPRLVTEGSYASVIGIFADQRLRGEPMTITGDGEQSRDFVSAYDVARANIIASRNEDLEGGTVINIGTGKDWTVNQIAKFIGGPIKYLPPRLEPKVSRADNTLARKLLGWEPSVHLPDWIEMYKKEMGLS